MKMLIYLCKHQSKTLNFKHNTIHTLNQCLIIPTVRCYSRKKNISTTDHTAFTTFILKNKCGLSGKAVIRASKYVSFGPSDVRPYRVLSLLQTFGFPLPSISKIVTKDPQILQFYPEKFIKPKLDFLLSKSFSQIEVVEIVTKNPFVLTRSLEKQLIPSFNLLKSVTGSYSNAVAVIRGKPFVLTYSVTKCFSPNMELLHTIGVPHSQILKLLTCYAQVLGGPHYKFRNVALKLKEMGFDLASSYLIMAVTERRFLKDYVNPHKDEVPEVVEAYEGKLKFDEYTFKQKGELNL